MNRSIPMVLGGKVAAQITHVTPGRNPGTAYQTRITISRFDNYPVGKLCGPDLSHGNRL